LLKGEEKMDTAQAVNSDQKGSSWARFSNGLRTYLRKPENIILLVCGIMLTVMILAPTITLFTDSFVIHTGNESLISELKPGTVTTYSWHYAFADMLSEGEFYKPLGRSLLVGVIACAFALAFGGITAWLVTRTNMPCKKYISTIFIFPYIMPQWTLATIWKYLFWSKQVDSTANGILANWGILTPKWFNEGLFPTALILGIHYAAFAYIMIGTVFKNMDSNLEEAATILNTPKWKIFLKITIPMITPAILSTILLVFSNAIGSYPVPYYLHYPDLAVKYLENLHDAPGFTSIIAMVMSAIGLVILYLNVLSSKSRKQYTTVTGKAGQVEPTKLGKVNRWIVAGILIIATAFTAIYPVIAFAIQTFLPNPNDFSSGLTTLWWTNRDIGNSKVMNEMGILYNTHIWEAFGNTIKTGLLCSLFAGTIGMLVGLCGQQATEIQLGTVRQCHGLLTVSDSILERRCCLLCLRRQDADQRYALIDGAGRYAQIHSFLQPCLPQRHVPAFRRNRGSGGHSECQLVQADVEDHHPNPKILFHFRLFLTVHHLHT
jgi:iron(III) transport system permease protein